MKISECIYCGMTAITENDVCTSCKAFLEPEPAAQQTAPNVSQPQQFQQEFQSSAMPAGVPVYGETSNNYPRQAPPVRDAVGGYNSFQPPNALTAKCLRCHAPTEQGQSQCFDCANRKKASPLKKFAVLLIIVAVIGFFSFDYVFAFVSPRGVFRKYAKATGADSSISVDTFSFKGEVRMRALQGFLFNAKTSEETLGTMVPKD
jgi:hypothetical protein